MTKTSKRSWHKSAAHQAAERHPPLHIDVGISPAHLILSLVLHLFAAAAILNTSLHWFATLIVLAGIVLSAGRSLRSARSKHHIIWHSTNLIEVTSKPCAKTVLGFLTDDTFHSTWFVVLALRLHNGRKHQCVIPADSVTQRDYRQLRSRLYLMSRDEFA